MSEYDKFGKQIKNIIAEAHQARTTKLVEFAPQSNRSPASIIAVLKKKFGKIVKIGGSKRVYSIGSNQKGYLYITDATSHAFVLAWNKSQPEMGVVTIYAWKEYRLGSEPEYSIQLPPIGDFNEMADAVAKWIINPKSGKIAEFDAPEGVTESMIAEMMVLSEMARRVSPDEFIDILKKSGEDLSDISIVDLTRIAQENDVQIPVAIRTAPEYKKSAFKYNFTGKDSADSPEAEDTNAKLSGAMGGATIDAQPETDDKDFQDLATLASVKKLKKMAGPSSNKLYLMGRKRNGAFFRVEGMEEVLAQIERSIENKLNDNQRADGRSNMEAQYDELTKMVTLIAGGQSASIKSLLLTGAPSSGKTYVVMKAVKALGLQEGKDYVVKKGRITTPAMYRTLIERIDGLVIFDDCDSVVEDKNAVNMLKGALDTDAIREISYDVRGTINTATMTTVERDGMIDSMSRILRNVPEEGDLERFSFLLKKTKKKKSVERDDVDDFADDVIDVEDGDEDDDLSGRIHELQQAIIHHLPNKIDFKGRIIFISNMAQDEWDSAILTRAYTMNMNFSSMEMLDYIEKIKDNIHTNLNDEQKQEVIDYIRELHISGRLRRQVNFRLYQLVCDIRLVQDWKAIAARSL
jgi:hypothetical protein